MRTETETKQFMYLTMERENRIRNRKSKRMKKIN